MKVKLPEFKRCCFCVPLRAGLLAWGYVKIIVDALITHFLASLILDMQLFDMAGGGWKHAMWVLLTLVIIVMFVTDFVASIVFIIGELMENVKLIRGFYIYSIVALIMSVPLGVLGFFFSMSSWRSTIAMNLTLIAGYLVIIVVQAYFILLLRSEVNTMNRSNEFRFVNNPAKAQCMMASKEKEAAVEKV